MAWQIAQMIINDIKQEVSQDRTVATVDQDKPNSEHSRNNNHDNVRVESTKL